MAFYNNYRPKTFSEILGQEQVTEILKKQAKTKSFHHAYLFFGSSGTGKTTTARILASSMNCLNGCGCEGEPCGTCQNCRTIEEGYNWDVREINGADFRGIDEIRDLIRRSYLYPVSGNKKVYIIDEAHALTQESFNCLLKLLEEPPPYLVIILVTTNFDRIPETVTSRCSLYPFKRLKLKDIEGKLQLIAEREGIELDPKHTQFIAQSSGGNLRKAENLFEQCVLIK